LEGNPETHHLLLQVTYNALASVELEGNGSVAKALEYLTKAKDVYEQFCEGCQPPEDEPLEQATSSLQELDIGAGGRMAPPVASSIGEEAQGVPAAVSH
jgi:hypothetical protein